MDNMIIQENGDEDRISRLPEDIISHILSRMPTREAIKTSVLSKAWEYKWTCVNSVQIYYDSYRRNEETLANFFNFVQRVVDQTRYATSFCLENINRYVDTGQITALIGAILMHPVKSLDLWLSPYHAVILPLDLINQNTSLETLKLSFNCSLRIPGTATFPTIKRLYLSDAVIENNSSNGTMTLYLPHLEIIELNDCTVRNVTMMEIHAPVLTTFHSTNPAWESDVYPIKIISEKVVVFRLDDNAKIHKTEEEFIIVGQQVVQAELNYFRDGGIKVDYENGPHLQNLLTLYLTDVKELTISDDLLQYISYSGEVTLPEFLHLVRLNVNNNYEDDLLAKGLLKLLHKTPCLKFLRIACNGSHYDYTPVEGYTPVEDIPMCMKDHLEEIEFKLDFYLTQREPLHLLNFLMENGKALKRIYIRRNNPYRRLDPMPWPVDEITQYLLAIPRNSTELLDVQFI